jgi:LPS O-antigen subunit length determinant protein (WzzB/FepE family)
MGTSSEIDLGRLIQDIWRGRWVIAMTTAAGLVLSAVIAFTQPDMYRAEALVAPNQDQAGGLSALEAQYGGLANLAGIDLAEEGIDKTELGLEILRSRQFISDFVERHDILVDLMAAEGWNRESRELEIDRSIYDDTAGKWVRDANPPRGVVPSSQEAHEVFAEDVLSISQDKVTGFVTIAVNHYSPDVAKQWVDWLVSDINATVMLQDVTEAQQAIAYLEEQIANTPLADLQNVFFRLIEEQTKTVLLAKVSPEYLFRTIDPAVAPELKSGPRRSVMLLIGLVLGFGAGAIFVLARAKA